jgi:hypothetical protein
MKRSTDDMRIRISSPPDREKLVAEIFCGNEQWAELNQESNTLTLEIYPRRDGKPWDFSFNKALSALQDAQRRLIGDERISNREASV